MVTEYPIITILDEYDGFRIRVKLTKQGRNTEYHFDQEDSRKLMVDMFKKLGFINVRYEEVY